MENVPQVLSEKEAWYSWCSCLEKLGYTNYCSILNAKDYKIPQNRKRCFMLSIYGNYSYEFPEKLGLDIRLKDILEKQVDEKYYLSDKMIACFTSEGTEKFNRKNRFEQALKLTNDKGIAGAITTLAGNRATDNFIKSSLKETLENNELENGSFIDLYNKSVNNNNAGTITTRVNASNNTYVAESLEREFIKVKNATKEGYLKAYDGDGIDLENGTRKGRRGTVQKGLSQTLKTQDSIGVVLKTELCNKLVREGQVEEGDVVKHSFTQQILDGKKKAVEKQDEMITLTTRGDCFGVTVKDEVKLLGGIGDKKSNGGTQYYEQDRVYSSEGIATAIPTSEAFSPNYNSGLRIRKLTPRECFKLMGVKQADYEKITNSDSSKYHLAGDSIVSTCLMAIFGKLFDLDYKSKIQEVVDEINKC